MTSPKELEVLFSQKRVNIESHFEKKKKKLLQKGNEEPALNFTLEGMLKTWRANRNLRAVFSETGRTSLLLPSGVLGGNIFLLFSVYKLLVGKET